jgi:CxxC motif-containing protein (DUF1111 family)
MNRGVALAVLLLLAHCSSAPGIEVPPATDDRTDPFNVPLTRATKQQVSLFSKGDALFNVPFRESDGLGPLFIHIACSSCHTEATKGPGFVQKMVMMGAEGLPSDDQSKLPFGHTVRPQISAGATMPILAPDDPTILTTTRIGPSVLGRGYLEAIEDGEIERTAAEQRKRTDRIGGRINRVVYASGTNPDTTFGAPAKGAVMIGRFGVKARIATLDDFAADALQGDMGVTNPLRPIELPNPDGLIDDGKPGVDVDADFVNDLANYLRLVEIPARRGFRDRGRQLFERVQCAVCHVPTMRTRADYPIAQLRGIDAPIYSDLLLHDMGLPLADGIAEGDSNWREWKTTPLIGLRFSRQFLHDGRATSIEEAIQMHAGSGSEATDSVRLFNELSEVDRGELLTFVGAL